MHVFGSSTAILISLLSAGGGTESTSSTVEAAAGTSTTADDAARPPPTVADRGGEPSQVPWIRRHPPRRNEVELGAYGGVLLPSRQHELYQQDSAQPDGGYDDLAVGAGTVGARVGYMPLRWLGVEAEGGASPTRTAGDARATVWHARGSVVGQVGRWSVVPFALVGVGALGVASSARGLGRDADVALHFGGGLKINTSPRFAVRLDLRDTVAARQGTDDGVTHNGEILLGAVVRLGRQPEPAPRAAVAPGDRDADGVVDPSDACPDRPGPAPSGCPVPDSDADGWLDPDDRCPDVAGVEPDGCPVLDRDRDTWLDDVDACPAEPGVAPDGCPLRDGDGDGLLDVDDACPEEPETRNAFEDADGCPDEVPAEVKAFTGVIEGIYFDLDRSTIRPRSRSVLDRAVEVLARYPSIHVEVSGHTDVTGGYEHNRDLSARRADSVKGYLVGHGISADRIVTRGAGPDEPLADNATRAGREKNRRIEFRIIEH